MEGQKPWNLILANLKSQISASNYKTWFGGAFVLDFKKSSSKNLLIIALKNNFIKEQVENRYGEMVREVVEKQKLNLEIVFVVSQKVQREDHKGPLFSGEAVSFFASANSESLNSFHTFGNLVVGSSNNLAYLAATQVATNLGAIYNPLLFYGPTGVGKTHLLQAIGNEVRTKVANAKILYVNAEKFTNDYIESLRNRTTSAFRQKYRGLDLLLVDDVQFFAGKESTQDEFFHTFNDLFLAGRQLVLASDKHPKELGRLKERLVSRFLGGLSCDIGLPDLEMKIAILRAKCSLRNVDLEDEAFSYIAQNCGGNVRELEGILVSLLATSSLAGGRLGLDDIKSHVERAKVAVKPKVTIGKVMETVCKHFRVSLVDVRGPTRRAPVVFARQTLTFLLRKELGLPLGVIGEMVGGRDHSTIIHGIEKINGLIAHNQERHDEILRLRTLIGSD